jgi:hypothetical protein
MREGPWGLHDSRTHSPWHPYAPCCRHACCRYCYKGLLNCIGDKHSLVSAVVWLPKCQVQQVTQNVVHQARVGGVIFSLNAMTEKQLPHLNLKSVVSVYMC